ncbi:T9SS type A sorting domain-containing protein [Wenyingzhuangia sp. IMCC45533]
MNKKNYLFKISCSILFTFLLSTAYSQTELNALDQTYYGYEITTGDTGWWMQHPANFSISTDRGFNSSSRSLKFVSDTPIDGTKRAFGSSLSRMLINLEPGDYDFKIYVYLTAGSDFDNIGFDIREGTTIAENITIDISSIAKDTWVPVTFPLTITNKITDGTLRVIMKQAFGTTGTVYVDNISILSYVTLLDRFTTINTETDNNLTLNASEQEVSLKVWVDNDCDIPNFYTQIDEPFTSLEWDISTVAKEEWVTLTQTVNFDEAVDNSEFKIVVNNSYKQNKFQGTFFIDEINFSEESLSNDNINGENDFFMSPNPANDFVNLNLEASTVERIVIYNTQGRQVTSYTDFSKGDSTLRLDLTSLKSGIYYVNVLSNENVTVKKLIIE